MSSLLWQLTLVALFGAASPLPITVVVTLLMTKGGVAKATGFAAGLIAVLAAIGIVTLITSSYTSASSSTESAVTGTIVAVMGLLLVLMAVKLLLNAPDPDAPPPKFMSALGTMSVARAVLFGAILAVINFKQLGIFIGGIAQIVEAEVPPAQEWVALAVLLIVLQLGVILPIIVFVATPGWASRHLRRFLDWLNRHSRPIGIVLGLVVGIWFLVTGIRQIW